MRLLLVAAFALPLALACSKNEASPSSASAAAPAQAAPKPGQVVVDGTGFHPSSIKLPKGATPATLTFTRTSDETCATAVVFPDLKIEKPLPLNTPVAVSIPVDQARTLTFQCGMGMFKSKIVVE